MSREWMSAAMYHTNAFLRPRIEVLLRRHGQLFIDLALLPLRIVEAPVAIYYGLSGAAQRGFHIPELASKIAFSSIFIVGTLGTYDIALEMGTKMLCPRNCNLCNGWQALRCTMCKGTGQVHFQVKDYRSEMAATSENVTEALSRGHAKFVHVPAFIDVPSPLPSKNCPTCDGTGVMSCSECTGSFPLRISPDNIMDPPWKPNSILKKMEYPYENVIDSMRDPKIAAFWLLTMPQIVGEFEFDDETKQKIWWSYKESMKYDQVRDFVARRKPGWEHLQDALISLDPVRSRNDPVIVRNVPYYKAKKALEAEVMKLDVPQRPLNWGMKELKLPLSRSLWTEEELTDPKKSLEMTTLLRAQREIAAKMLDVQWERSWREQKLKELLEEKLQPHLKNMKDCALPKPVIIEKKERKRRRWWFF